ncbi:hypothetical protein MMP66_16935 [Acinetobacter dispersus]|uniref:hypothetical protein n=1 Tax=Acinetobacter dispersus TaxID=70348 RepID=UPI001F4B21E2|nr:hypothetical protein [Acinetobacter dispersus]MCH7395939.1 hypothetical protein [Acinetobacter dispersus]
MKNIDLNTILTLSVTYFVSAFLGYHYIAGRAYIEGITLNTGITYSFLGFDFSDYFFYGFLHSFHLLLYIPLIIGFVWFIIVFRREIKNYKKDDDEAKANKLWKLETHMIFMFTTVGTIILLLLIPLKHWISLQEDGHKTKVKSISDSIDYVLKDKEKFFTLICGKDRCLYAKKDLSGFYNTKEDEYETSILQPYTIINYSNNSKNYYAYLLSKTKKVKNNLYIFQIDKATFGNLRDISVLLKAKTNSSKNYSPISSENSNRLNTLYQENSGVFFVGFSIPVTEEVEYLYINHVNTTN